MSAWAKPGVKCVFVGGGNDNPSDWPLMTGVPEQGVVYTIRDLGPGTGKLFGRPVLRLHEITLRPNNEPWEDAWIAVSNFRPLVSLEDDIATHFEHHLHNDHRAPAKADA